MQINHPQLICCNFFFHDKRRGYLKRQDMQEIMIKIETLLDTRPDEVPTEIKFLLEFDHGKLALSTIHNHTYWVVAMEAALKAGTRTSTTDVRRRRAHKKPQNEYEHKSKTWNKQNRGHTPP